MELRLYSFVNYYLSPIQAGIQTGHAAVQLVRHYAGLTHRDHDMVMDWADDHKTFIVLNGGNNAQLISAHEAVMNSGYPYSAFFEDEASLGGIMTCVAVVVPESVFNAKRIDPNSEIEYYRWTSPDETLQYVYGPATPEFALIKLLKSSRLF